MQRIGIVSTRIAGTDGVSLETFKWFQVLERNGYDCFFFAGEAGTPPERTLVDPEAHFAHPEVRALHEALFGVTMRPRSLTDEIRRRAETLKRRLYEFLDLYRVELLVVENALAIPMHIPLGVALTELLAETGLPCIAHHHDFSWERERFIINCVHDYLSYAFPPVLPNLEHVVINSAASRELSFRRGISNVVIPNVFDFASEPRCDAERCSALRRELGLSEEDLFVLQPTRIVARKRIERAIDLVAYLRLPKPYLIISHESGDEGDGYRDEILRYAERQGVKLILLGDRVAPARCFGEQNNRPFTMDDVYCAADLVTYPSSYEGFGNAFVEAIYFRKPIVVNRYSIYVEDIEPKGFQVIAFEEFITEQVVEKVRRFLDPEVRRAATERNYELGRRYFSYEVLEGLLLPLLHRFA